MEIEHIYVRTGIRFILQRNSSYAPGDEAIFMTDSSNIGEHYIELAFAYSFNYINVFYFIMSAPYICQKSKIVLYI